ncbi:MAG: hypothetical protein ACXVRJ_10815, partial [Gaiellaceae bacterium]
EVPELGGGFLCSPPCRQLLWVGAVEDPHPGRTLGPCRLGVAGPWEGFVRSVGAVVTSPAERLEQRDGFLSRGDLATLGLPRRAVDAVFRACPVVAFPGYSKPLVRVVDYLELVERSTYRGNRVRPC